MIQQRENQFLVFFFFLCLNSGGNFYFAVGFCCLNQISDYSMNDCCGCLSLSLLLLLLVLFDIETFDIVCALKYIFISRFLLANFDLFLRSRTILAG